MSKYDLLCRQGKLIASNINRHTHIFDAAYTSLYIYTFIRLKEIFGLSIFVSFTMNCIVRVVLNISILQFKFNFSAQS